MQNLALCFQLLPVSHLTAVPFKARAHWPLLLLLLVALSPLSAETDPVALADGRLVPDVSILQCFPRPPSEQH